LNWTAPGGRPAKDWIGFFKVSDPNQNYDRNRWTHAGGATSGTYSVTVPSTEGTYHFRYVLDGPTYTTASTSNSVAVIVSGATADAH
jgi:hypothetical protein